MTIAEVIATHRLVVCVGAGGVGKTTIAAALAVGAAAQGRRAIVLTIDPARALARSLGLATLAPGGEVVPLAALAAAEVTLVGSLSAAMLDPKVAWDAFVARHAPSPAVARALTDNPFYQRVSSSFAGSTEYMAIEEVCRLVESARYDLVVLDTPPAAHAVDFLRAPARIDALFENLRAPDVLMRTAGVTARLVMRQLERAAGEGTLREIATFFGALDALIDGIRARTGRARALLQGADAAFVLVAGPRPATLDDTTTLATALRAHAAPLAAVVVNRLHPAPVIPAADAHLATLGASPAAAWLRARWADLVDEAAAEERVVEPFLRALPADVARGRIAEAAQDVHALRDLAAIAAQLGLPDARRTRGMTPG